MDYYYGLLDIKTKDYGFLTDDHPQVNPETMIKVSEEERLQLLEEEKSGKEIVCYDGKVFTAEPEKYYVDDEGNWQKKTDEEFENEKAQRRKEEFEKTFFLTTLGYIRRKVSMATGDTKDFLSDLLPAISAGVQLGQQVPIITYKKPDFTQEITIEYMESLQEVKAVTPEFIQECVMQISTDFLATPLNL